ncbi:hypothetical protein [Streptomyces humicola]|uniref:hypothetical protein n=1 Tax=Streptomyces humicola TaxID=2953240 RepID=UPI003557E2E3
MIEVPAPRSSPWPPASRRDRLRTQVPDRKAVLRRVSAVLAGQTDEWTEQGRYIGPDILAECRGQTSTNPGASPTPRELDR